MVVLSPAAPLPDVHPAATATGASLGARFSRRQRQLAPEIDVPFDDDIVLTPTRGERARGGRAAGARGGRDGRARDGRAQGGRASLGRGRGREPPLSIHPALVSGLTAAIHETSVPSSDHTDDQESSSTDNYPLHL